MQSLLNRAISKLHFYCGSRRRRQSRREADQTERAHRWPRERIEQYTQERLAVLLRRAAQMVPFYSRVFAQRGWDPLQAQKYWPEWPILTQQMLQENRDELIAKDVQKSTLRLGGSGGSTGHNKTFYHGREFGRSKAAAVTHSDSLAGWAPGARIALLWPATPRTHGAVRPLSSLKSLLKNQRLYNSYDMSQARMGEYHRDLSRYQPDVIIAFAGAAFELARFLKSNQLRPNYPSKGIITSAETLTPPMRSQINEVFSKPIFDRYGSWEVGLMAFECEAHAGLHTAFTHNLIEVVSPGSLEPIWDREGDILVTTLGEPDCPLIRYQIGDVGIMTERVCSCGRNSLCLRKVLGREMDAILTPAGRIIRGVFASPFHGIAKVRQFQVVQRKLDQIDVRLVLAEPLNRDEEARIRSVFAERLGSEMTCQIKVVDYIDPLPSGKRAFVISQLQ